MRRWNWGFIMAALFCLLVWGVIVYSALMYGAEIPIYSDEPPKVPPDELWYLNHQ